MMNTNIIYVPVFSNYKCLSCTSKYETYKYAIHPILVGRLHRHEILVVKIDSTFLFVVSSEKPLCGLRYSGSS